MNRFGEECKKIGTVYQNKNAYFEIISVHTFETSWRETCCRVYLKHQKSPVLYHIYTYLPPSDLVEIKSSDIEDFERVKEERIKDSQERLNLLNQKWLNSEINIQ